MDMVEQVAGVLSAEGLTPAVAETLAVAITNKMAKSWGGQFIYFPKGIWNDGTLTCFQLQERDLKIYAEYNGTNQKEICEKYGIKKTRLYEIITAIRQARRNTRQSVPSGG